MIQKINLKWLAVILMLRAISGAEESSILTEAERAVSSSSGTKALDDGGNLGEICTSQGVIYKDCHVIRVETDALFIRHQNGMAKVSFFDLGPELQSQFDFDPVAGMKKFRNDHEALRQFRWELFWENQKQEAAVKLKREQEEHIARARREWVPVTAQILRRTPRGAYVTASRITFVPTKVKSTLGFEIDGPLKKKLVPFEPNVIFLEVAGIEGPRWEGYLDPITRESITESAPDGPDRTIPVHRAVAHVD